MSYDSHNTASIPIGTPVIAFNGDLLGTVRDVHPHFILVHQEGQHGDLDIPVNAIVGFEDGNLRVSVNREAITEIDDAETYHQRDEE